MAVGLIASGMVLDAVGASGSALITAGLLTAPLPIIANVALPRWQQGRSHSRQ